MFIFYDDSYILYRHQSPSPALSSHVRKKVKKCPRPPPPPTALFLPHTCLPAKKGREKKEKHGTGGKRRRKCTAVSLFLFRVSERKEKAFFPFFLFPSVSCPICPAQNHRTEKKTTLHILSQVIKLNNLEMSTTFDTPLFIIGVFQPVFFHCRYNSMG